MAISNRLKSVKAWLGLVCSHLAVRFSALLVLTTKVRQTTLHSITDIMEVVAVVAADIMDMDKAECSISRILPVRHPRCRDNNNYPFE
jgi:uncharacterized membrane protein YjjP (DUF1212 family)